MKYSIKLCLAWLCFLCLNANAQNPFWTFPEQALEPSGMLNLPTDDYTGQESDYVHAGIKDPYGETTLFIVDGVVYDKTGFEAGEIDDGTEIVRGYSESLIVPQPGSCNII